MRQEVIKIKSLFDKCTLRFLMSDRYVFNISLIEIYSNKKYLLL